MLKLVVWLWNPWDKYRYTRHNIWFIVLDWIKDKYQFTNFLFNKKFNAELSSWKIGKFPIILVKPLTFMNLSGEAVWKIVRYYKIKPKDILIVHDDIDLPLWKIKLKYNWSSWWHNWIKSIINHLKTDKFWRLKIWIWRPPTKEEVVNYVLSNFTKEEFAIIEDKKNEIFDKLEQWLKNTWS